MSEERDVPSTVFSPGDYPKLGDYSSTFTIPVLQLLADRMIKEAGPQIYEVISAEDVIIKDGGGATIVVLTHGCVFVSLAQEKELAWQPCRFQWTRR